MSPNNLMNHIYNMSRGLRNCALCTARRPGQFKIASTFVGSILTPSLDFMCQRKWICCMRTHFSSHQPPNSCIGVLWKPLSNAPKSQVCRNLIFHYVRNGQSPHNWDRFSWVLHVFSLCVDDFFLFNAFITTLTLSNHDIPSNHCSFPKAWCRRLPSSTLQLTKGTT